MGKNITDIIERYLKDVLSAQEDKVIEIKRNEIADQFQCVPSQINYVINTRFTMEKGYMIESKRGGGGYIRISRIQHQDGYELIEYLLDLVEERMSQQAAEHIIERLYEKEVITKREKKLMLVAIDRETLAVALPERDQLRSRILKQMLNTLKYKER